MKREYTPTRGTSPTTIGPTMPAIRRRRRKKKVARKKSPRKTGRPKGRRNRATIRKLLLEGTLDGDRADTSPTGQWFKAHGGAREFVDLWIEMAGRGECAPDITMRWVHRELVKGYGFPYDCPATFSRWAQRKHGSRYDDAVKSRRRVWRR